MEHAVDSRKAKKRIGGTRDSPNHVLTRFVSLEVRKMSQPNDLDAEALLGEDLDEIWGDSLSQNNDRADTRADSNEPQARVSRESTSQIRSSDGSENPDTVSSMGDQEMMMAYPRSWASSEQSERDRSLPSPRWHCEDADQPYRQGMIIEIARLLKGRKKCQPSKEWLEQLPYKAHELEYRLYISADSLESYLNRSTLKERLMTVARWFINHHQRRNRTDTVARARGSASSIDTAFSTGQTVASRSSIRDSITSAESTYTHRDSVRSHASLDSLSSLQQAMNQNSIISSRGAHTGDSRPSFSSHSNPFSNSSNELANPIDARSNQGRASGSFRGEQHSRQATGIHNTLVNPSNDVSQASHLFFSPTLSDAEQNSLQLHFGLSSASMFSTTSSAAMGLAQAQAQQASSSLGTASGQQNLDTLARRQATLLTMMGVRYPQHHQEASFQPNLSMLGSNFPPQQTMTGNFSFPQPQQTGFYPAITSTSTHAFSSGQMLHQSVATNNPSSQAQDHNFRPTMAPFGINSTVSSEQSLQFPLFPPANVSANLSHSPERDNETHNYPQNDHDNV